MAANHFLGVLSMQEPGAIPSILYLELEFPHFMAT